MELSEIRVQIDEVDQQIVDLYQQRMALCEKVAETKLKSGSKVLDTAREKEKIDEVRALAEGEFNRKGIAELFAQLMSQSRKLQYARIARDHQPSLPFIEVEELDTKAGVVYQGAEGSYSQAATEAYFGKNIQASHVETFRDAMISLEEGSAAYAVLPIENSTAGIVSEIYDLLAEFEHFIVGEQMVKIEHCLMGVDGTDLSTIRTVYSHPQSLMQSEHFLRMHPQWEQISMKNNAFAARKVAEEKDVTQAAIAGAHAAEAYGLNIIERGVNHSSTNTTRFIVISNRKIYLKKAGKISLCFEIPHESGSLYRILSHFIYNDLNMTKIESRPIEERNWEYRFFLDFEGNLSDPAVRNALCGLREETRGLRILGNY